MPNTRRVLLRLGYRETRSELGLSMTQRFEFQVDKVSKLATVEV